MAEKNIGDFAGRSVLQSPFSRFWKNKGLSAKQTVSCKQKKYNEKYGKKGTVEKKSD